ncbi:MAG TPA: DNA methyltransferase, partial [Beijerinckiaceae bacterium]|nr:DNA methyltransferase [Beijerinckiaceae bacterium]
MFSRRRPGFDSIVGNPPFLGGKKISSEFGDCYRDWLPLINPDSNSSADIVAHFFRRSFSMLRPDRALGLIATKTIGQGDTREGGLALIIADGGAISRVTKRIKWPGEASVIVSVIHIVKGLTSEAMLDDAPVSRISAYLVEGNLDRSPVSLATNARIAFQGSIILSLGFTFDDQPTLAGKANPLSTIECLIQANPRNSERIFPYIGGEEINSDPRQLHKRYAIDFFDRPLNRDPALPSWADMAERERSLCLTKGSVPADYPFDVAEDWPDLISIVRRRVKPERDVQKRKALRERWWQYADKRPGLYGSIRSLARVIVIARV